MASLPGHQRRQRGDDHLVFVGDGEAMLRAIERFLEQVPAPRPSERMLASVLIVRMDGAARAPELARAFGHEVARWRGQTIDGDSGWLAALFDGPGRAVRSGLAVMSHARDQGIAAAAGVHIGECDPHVADGPIYEVAKALAASGPSIEVRVSRTVVDLVPGSGIGFTDRGVVHVGTPPRPVPVLAADRPLETGCH